MDVIHLLITLVVVAIVIFGGFWVVDKMALAAPWRMIALIVWGVICLVILLGLVGIVDLHSVFTTRLSNLDALRAPLA